MMKHIHMTMRLHACRGKFLWYDAEFRRLRSELKFSFGSYIYELFEQAKDYRISFSHPNMTYDQGSSQGRHNICYMYQKSGKCTRRVCGYKHECTTCGGKHPTRSCDKPTRGQGSNARQGGGPFRLPARVQPQ